MIKKRHAIKNNTIAIVGRPNVGKSTLFNALTRTRRALVADKEGVTRDRRLGRASAPELGSHEIFLLDTGGWLPKKWRQNRKDEALLSSIEVQIQLAIEEAALVFLVVDSKAGMQDLDQEMSRFLLQNNKQFIVVANKHDSHKQSGLEHEFYKLGGDCIVPVSAEHRRGFLELWEEARARMDLQVPEAIDPEAEEIRVCIVGRPNVGKSTLLNCLLAEERAVADSTPGTTTDPIDVRFQRGKTNFVIVDTAGIRRGSKRGDDLEHLSVMYAKRNLKSADLAILVLNAEDGITGQDGRIAELVYESGCAAIVLANKWDLAPKEVRQDTKKMLRQFAHKLREKLPIIAYAPVLAFSALDSELYSFRSGEMAQESEPVLIPHSIDGLWGLIKLLMRERSQQIATSDLNRFVRQLVDNGPNIARSIGKVYFAHQQTKNAPKFTAYVKKSEEIPESFRRYLIRSTRKRYGFTGNPIFWDFSDKSKREK